MSATVTPPAGARSASPDIIRPALVGLGVLVAIAGLGFGIALVAGATAVINLLVFTLFTVLWIAFVAALVFSPGTLDDTWHWVRSLPLVIQGVVVLLFLPIAIGLWIWERSWALPARLTVIAALAVWNIYMFFPRAA